MFFIVVLMLLVLPPIVMLAFHLAEGRWPNWWALAAALLILLTPITDALRISFIASIANILWIIICYFGYFAIFLSCLQLRRRSLRWIATVMTAMPICCGLLAATIGMLGLLFILEDAKREPVYVEQIGDRLTCRVTLWGAAFTDSGYKGSLYRTWTAIPFLWREVGWIGVNESAGGVVTRSFKIDHPQPRNNQELCAQLASDYQSGR
ncbi:MAG: hypothetical protein K2X10_13390 [Hyphomicrobiales bacterium]|nr:hypothetical protein [Hyphomicrobiales bacterium]